MQIRLLAAACLVIAAANTHAQVAPTVPTDDRERDQVRRAVLDYVEGFYEGDTVKLTRALRPDVSKYGYWRDSTGKYDGERMSFAEAIAYGKKVKGQNRPVNLKWPKDVVIFEAQDQTASAKVTAWWGTDYLLLGKYDGRWMITDVLWQGPLRR